MPYMMQYGENQIPNLSSDQLQQSIVLQNHLSTEGFKLSRNWNYLDKHQQIKITLSLGDIDKRNIGIIHDNFSKISTLAGRFTTHAFMDITDYSNELSFTIDLDDIDKQFSVLNVSDNGTWNYLKDYNLYNHLIDLYNFTSDEKDIDKLGESFAVLGSYRNYGSIGNAVSLSSDAKLQLRSLRHNDHSKSLRTFDSSEPSIFNMVRIAVADEHVQELRAKGETEANNIVSPILTKINEKLKLINLECELKLVDINSWSYSFNFIDTLRNQRVIENIDDLSAGQKSLLHLIFEAYGRGKYEGGLVVIDEPELHLHFQFQSAYLHIIKEISSETNNQYILVTHSESLISSQTINTVSRLIRNEAGDTTVYQPKVKDHTRKQLIKILDNTRSTYALFARKVILVEGDTDRYLFHNIIEKVYLNQSSTTAVLDIGGKSNYQNWRSLFEAYGIDVYFIGDFDNVYSLVLENGSTLVEKALETSSVNNAAQKKLDTVSAKDLTRIEKSLSALNSEFDSTKKISFEKFSNLVSTVRDIAKSSDAERIHELGLLDPDVETKIDGAYSEGVFILKKGAIEDYTHKSKKSLDAIVDFCDKELATWLADDGDESKEILTMLTDIFSK